MNRQQRRGLLIASGTPASAAVLGGLLAGDGPTTWYLTLRTSRVVLPIWAFLPVALLYPTDIQLEPFAR